MVSDLDHVYRHQGLPYYRLNTHSLRHYCYKLSIRRMVEPNGLYSTVIDVGCAVTEHGYLTVPRALKWGSWD
jgi:hypothetical protein